MSEEIGDNVNAPERYKRKRKKSFLKNAKKYGKKGYFGRGSHLDADTYQYFVRIMEVYKKGFDNDEDKASFVNNVFEQTKDKEINCCCNQVGCRIVEMLLPMANDEVLLRFIKAFNEDIRPLCSDPFASHVLEALLTTTTTKCFKTDSEADFMNKCKEFTLKVSKFLLNNLEDFIWDTYGNHIIRTCLQNLAQITKTTASNTHHLGNELKKEKEEEAEEIQIPEDFIEVIRNYGERLLCWPQFNDLICSELTSGFIQVLLIVLKKTDKKMLRSYLTKIIDESFIPKLDQDILKSKPAIMVMESCIEVANKKQFTQIFAKCFFGKLANLAISRNTNFIVQKLINHCREKEDFEAIYKELEESFEDIKAAGHTGILLALAQGCKKFSTKQGPFVQSIMKCLKCFEPEERQNDIVKCLSKLTSYENLEKTNEYFQNEKLNLHGTLILQIMLEFNKPIKIVNSILSLDSNSLKNLFTNSMGSHIMDSYCKSQFVGEKSREKLIRKLKGNYQALVSNRYGSRSFEAIWEVATLKNRLAIMDELSYKDGGWSNNNYGKIIAAKINLIRYKRNKDDWKNSLNTVNKAKEIFADIIK